MTQGIDEPFTCIGCDMYPVTTKGEYCQICDPEGCRHLYDVKTHIVHAKRCWLCDELKDTLLGLDTDHREYIAICSGCLKQAIKTLEIGLR